MSTRSDREWMYKRKEDGYLSASFYTSVDYFLDVAFSNEATVDKDCIKCPCSKCKNMPYKTRDEVKLHLLQYGFMPNYTTWWAHGEETTICQHEMQPSNQMEDDDVDGCTRMVMDAMGAEDSFTHNREEEVTNPSAKEFYDMLLDADEPLWEGCQNYSRLQAASELLNWKSEYNISEAAYDHLLPIIKRMLPASEKLVANFYDTKKILRRLRLPSQKIDFCKNHCMLYYGEASNLTKCRYCQHDRYKRGRLTSVPYKAMRYLSIAHRLKRLFMTKKTAEQMGWHYEHRTEPGLMAHPSDGHAWKHFDSMHPEFASDPRNVRLGLCTDGFSPNNSNSSPYSCWPVFLSIYNLPPWMCLKDSYVQLSIVIPGKKSPGQNLDVFLQPLIDELKMLYNDGVVVYDASRRENFTMRAILLWTVSDFPAYAMLSGWSTHGKLACPYCMGESGSFQLHHGGKPCWFDCHRKLLPPSHPYRNDRQGFLSDQTMRSHPPLILTGDQIWEQIRHFPTVYEGSPHRPTSKKIPGFGITHNWVKRSIFWELPYWRTLLIRHNLDVMHIEKNFFDNVFNTVIGNKKSKDGIKARKDLEIYCSREHMHVYKKGSKDMMNRAPFTMTRQQVGKICAWLCELKFPDGYASNLGGCVNLEDSSFYSFKSHECHVFMQRLLPIALRGMLPNPVWTAITELCTFFRAICSRVLRLDELEHLQKTIVETICKLEKIFPPGFFDSMEHLVVHLTREAILGGPVQYRWMYIYERKLGSIKRKIKNQAQVEGSIVQAYIIGEISMFCSKYFEPTIETRLNREPRNFAPDIPSYTRVDSRLSIFKVPSRRLFEKGGRRKNLSDEEMRIAHNYILINCEEVYPFIRMFENFARREQPHIDHATLARFRDQHFAEWFKTHVKESYDMDQNLKGLARGPFRHALSHKGYFVNGYKFHTEKYGARRVTHNSGVCVKGDCYNENECDYYGLLDEVLEVEYQGVGRCVVVLFKCTWFDADEGVNVDRKHNLVDIKYKSRLRNNDPFILASQATQVYYAPYPSMTRELKDWWAVVKTKPRSIYELPEPAREEANEEDEEQEHFFQESEALIDTTSPGNEVEEPICFVVEGEPEEVIDTEPANTRIEANEDEAEFEDSSSGSDDEEEFDDSFAGSDDEE